MLVTAKFRFQGKSSIIHHNWKIYIFSLSQLWWLVIAFGQMVATIRSVAMHYFLQPTHIRSLLFASLGNWINISFLHSLLVYFYSCLASFYISSGGFLLIHYLISITANFWIYTGSGGQIPGKENAWESTGLTVNIGKALAFCGGKVMLGVQKRSGDCTCCAHCKLWICEI